MVGLWLHDSRQVNDRLCLFVLCSLFLHVGASEDRRARLPCNSANLHNNIIIEMQAHQKPVYIVSRGFHSNHMGVADEIKLLTLSCL